jgi:hypothetical protein
VQIYCSCQQIRTIGRQFCSNGRHVRNSTRQSCRQLHYQQENSRQRYEAL